MPMGLKICTHVNDGLGFTLFRSQGVFVISCISFLDFRSQKMVQNWVTTVPLRCKPVVQNETLTNLFQSWLKQSPFQPGVKPQFSMNSGNLKNECVDTTLCTLCLVFYIKNSTKHVMLTTGLKKQRHKKIRKQQVFKSISDESCLYIRSKNLRSFP